MSLFAWTLFHLQVATSLPVTTQPTRAIEYYAPERICEINDRELNEASGLVASRRKPGIYYTHNDSGGRPTIYAIDRSGAIQAKIELLGAKNMDWEDIAIAPGKAANTWDICVGDIGDNKSDRRFVTLYRFEEPDFSIAGSGESARIIEVRPSTFEIRYEDGPSDAEALLVHPKTGDGYIIQKRREGPAAIYKFPAPWNNDGIQVLKRCGELRFPTVPPIQRLVTAADFSPDGRRLAARTYVCGWIWELPPQVRSEATAILFQQQPQRIDLAAEKQGEAICFSSDGGCLLTVSEGTPTAIYECCESVPASRPIGANDR